MKTFEKIMKGMTWAAWAAFVYGIATMETPSATSCLCLVFSAVWLITGTLVQEAAGDDA